MRLLSILLACLICAAILPAQRQVVREIKYMNFEPVSVNEILQAFKEKNVKFGVERDYNAQEISDAKAVLEGLLAAKGKSGVRVNVTTRNIPPSSVGVVFTAVAD